MNDFIFRDIAEKNKWINDYNISNDSVTLQNFSAIFALS